MEKLSFIISTDNACDLPEEYLAENSIPTLPLTFSFDGKTFYENMDPKEFYQLVREGGLSKSHAVNMELAYDEFKKLALQGNDVLHLSISAGLSASYSNCEMAAQRVREEFPERKIIVVDSGGASLGQGLFVHYAVQMRQQGKTIDEAAKWLEENKLRFVYLFTVDDLNHLHRGGRVSKASAVVGSMLGIKPMLHVENDGTLAPYGKVRGRKQSLQALVDDAKKHIGDYKNDVFMLSHSDCLEDAKYVVKLVQEQLGIKNYILNYIGPVIGTHTGIGTIAFFVVGNYR